MNVIDPNFNPIREFDPNWITNKIDITGINYLENLGFYLCDKKQEKDTFPGRDAVTVSQIRNIFGEVKRIESNLTNNKADKENESKDVWKQDFLFLRPKIAYAAARVLSRSRNSRIKVFKDVLEKAHELVGDDDIHMQNFAKFFEAIVAYHKVYGGKE